MKTKVEKVKTNSKRKIDWKKIVERIKTVTLIIIVAAAAGFYLGVQYQKSQTAEIEQKIEAVTAAQVADSSKQ